MDSCFLTSVFYLVPTFPSQGQNENNKKNGETQHTTQQKHFFEIHAYKKVVGQAQDQSKSNQENGYMVTMAANMDKCGSLCILVCVRM